MSVWITTVQMSSTVSDHSARRVEGGWQLSWLPGEVLTRTAAVTGMQLVDEVKSVPLVPGDPRWPLLDSWAGELGLTGPDAVARASRSLAQMTADATQVAEDQVDADAEAWQQYSADVDRAVQVATTADLDFDSAGDVVLRRDPYLILAEHDARHAASTAGHADAVLTAQALPDAFAAVVDDSASGWDDGWPS